MENCCLRKQMVKDYFKRTAQRWDEMRKGFFDTELGLKIVRQAKIKLGDTVVDIGCGTGFLTSQAAKAVGRKGKVIGIDLSEEMLEKADEKMTKISSTGRVEFKIGDAENIPLEDEIADAVIGNMILHHCPEPKSAIREMARILKTNGRLVLSDLEEHEEEWLKTEMADMWLGFRSLELEEWFRKAHLEAVEVLPARSKCCGVSLAGRRAAIGILIAKGVKKAVKR
jgi:ubiquinone/menaquinone biosynthesis C-methylase UbiE